MFKTKNVFALPKKTNSIIFITNILRFRQPPLTLKSHLSLELSSVSILLLRIKCFVFVQFNKLQIVIMLFNIPQLNTCEPPPPHLFISVYAFQTQLCLIITFGPVFSWSNHRALI